MVFTLVSSAAATDTKVEGSFVCQVCGRTVVFRRRGNRNPALPFPFLKMKAGKDG
jgi:hypothetical protein